MSRTPAATPWVRVVLLMCAWVAGVVALSVWLIPQTPEGTWMRWAAWAGSASAMVLGAWLIRGPRSSRLRQR